MSIRAPPAFGIIDVILAELAIVHTVIILIVHVAAEPTWGDHVYVINIIFAHQ